MKNKIIFLLFMIISLLFTFWDVWMVDLGKFLFAKGSEMSLQLAVSHWVFRVMVFTMFLLSLLLVIKKRTRSRITMLVLLVCLWVWSIRSVGFFPDGRVIKGLAFIQIRQFELCLDNEIPEEVINMNTIVTSDGLWEIRIENKNCNILILSGPFFHEHIEIAMSDIFPIKVAR
jgi:hypothetical protein